MLKQYLPLCWFRGYPAELPTTKAFLWRCLFFYLIAGYFIQVNLTDPVVAFIQVFLELSITLLFIAVLLAFQKSFEHFERLTSAFILCEIFLYVLALPLAIWYVSHKESELLHYPIYAAAVLIVWFCAMISCILKRFFSFSILSSITLAIVYFLITYLGSFALLL